MFVLPSLRPHVHGAKSALPLMLPLQILIKKMGKKPVSQPQWSSSRFLLPSGGLKFSYYCKKHKVTDFILRSTPCETKEGGKKKKKLLNDTTALIMFPGASGTMFEQPILVCDQYESSRLKNTCDTLLPLPPPPYFGVGLKCF